MEGRGGEEREEREERERREDVGEARTREEGGGRRGEEWTKEEKERE
jgi:hypothetical protein